MRRLEGHESVVTKILPVEYMVTSSYDRSIKLWRIQDWSVVASFTNEGPMLCCAASQDGRTVLAGEASGRIHCLRIETSR
jgi:WD40 repeat protein